MEQAKPWLVKLVDREREKCLAKITFVTSREDQALLAAKRCDCCAIARLPRLRAVFRLPSRDVWLAPGVPSLTMFSVGGKKTMVSEMFRKQGFQRCSESKGFRGVRPPFL
jgi:hypothetical protein